MKITLNEAWDVTSSGVKEVVLVKNGIGDIPVSELYVNPLSNCSITVKGFVNQSDTTGITLASVDIANLEKKATITTAGNYLFIVGSYHKVVISVTGTSKVLLKGVF